MKVKIDTKEKMHVITVEEGKLAANMTEEFKNSLLNYLNAPVKNIVISLEAVDEMDDDSAELLLSVQQVFYESNHSLVFCKLKPAVEKFLDEQELLEMMNVTPTESEACDIVQMEEIEREFI
ncbi:MAG: STAS domain-containing protein [Ginsengibacter sp.]